MYKIRLALLLRFIIYFRRSNKLIIYLQGQDVSIFDCVSAGSKVSLCERNKDIRDADDDKSSCAEYITHKIVKKECNKSPSASTE